MTQKVSVYMETYGCSANQSHSEVMMGLLRDEGCLIVTEPKEADVLVINTCIVKEPTEKRMIYRIKKLRKEFPEKNMIIAGCMPVARYEMVKKMAPNASFLGPNSSLKIVKCLKNTLEGERYVYLEEKEENKLCSPRYRFNPYVNIVEIAQGCLGNCSYCIVKRAKGSLFSYPMGDIKRDIEMSLKSGCREIWLTSQDCGCYGFDINTSLTDLLRHVTRIKGNFRVRLGMSNPNHIKPLLSDLIKLYRDKKLYKFLHIPIQSGSDNVLRDMNRHYETKDFRQIVTKFRLKIHDVTIWTDVIVGFPGETDTDFKETIGLLRATEPDFVNLSKFGLRPGTKAENMEQVPNVTIKERSRQVSDIVDKISLERNKRWIDRECRVLVTKVGRQKNQCIGRNEAYKSVVIETDKDIRGKFVTVRIRNAKKSHLVGVIQDV